MLVLKARGLDVYGETTLHPECFQRMPICSDIGCEKVRAIVVDPFLGPRSRARDKRRASKEHEIETETWRLRGMLAIPSCLPAASLRSRIVV